MSRTYVQEGENLSWVNTTGSLVVSGAPVVVGGRVGVSSGDIPNGETGELHVTKVHKLPKVAAQAITMGTPVYWDADGDPAGGVAGTGCMTTTATDNTLAGYAAAPAASADTTVDVKLNG